MNLQDELKALKERIAELEELEKEEEKFPKVGDEYWYISSNGYIFHAYNDGITRADVGLLKIGNMFRTKDQAEFAVEKLKVEAELRKFSRPFMWGTGNTAMLFDGDNIKFDTRLSHVFQGAIYFESENKAKEAIDTVGEERIKKYIFGVEG